MTPARLLQIFDEEVAKARKLIESKNADYSTRDDALFNLRRAGLYGVAVRLDDKTSRLIALLGENKTINHESLEDTLRDILNYAVLGRVLMREKEEFTPQYMNDPKTAHDRADEKLRIEYEKFREAEKGTGR